MGAPTLAQGSLPGFDSASSQTIGSEETLRGSLSVEHADAYDALRRLEPESVDLLITSPPYWGQRTYGLEHCDGIIDDWLSTGATADQAPPYEWYRDHGGLLGMEPTPDWYVRHLVEILEAAHAFLKPEGSMWINLGDTYFARWASIRDQGRQGLGDTERTRRRVPMGSYRQEKQLLLIPARFAIAMQDVRWILRNDLIWHKPNVPPRPEKDRLRHAHEHFFHFVKRPKEGRARYYYDVDMAEEHRTDVVTSPARPGLDGHSATFPLTVVMHRILTSSPPDGVIVDPFCGTAAALEWAASTGRHAFGWDLNREFIERVTRRLASDAT